MEYAGQGRVIAASGFGAGGADEELPDREGGHGTRGREAPHGKDRCGVVIRHGMFGEEHIDGIAPSWRRGEGGEQE